ncbi:MAG: SCO family protein [Phycisphaerae bacterium]|nr:SCO family protein [Phycisphaerae bacterium]
MKTRLAILALATASVLPAVAMGQSSAPVIAPGEAAALSSELPKELEGVEFVEHLGETVPMDLRFTDDDGSSVSIADLLKPGRPLLIHLGYFKCPMMCSLVLNEAVRGLQGIDWTVGREFDVVSVSINPSEDAQLAHAKKAGYVAEYGRTGSEKGWHFLTGPAESTHAFAESVGFRFKLLDNGDYSHPGGMIVVSPKGVITRYLHGVRFPPETFRLSLVEGSEGTIGSSMDRVMLWCFQYDASTNSYVPFVFRLVKVGGALTVVAIVAAVGLALLRERRARRLQPPTTAAC